MRQIAIEDVEAAVAGGATLVDVREPMEYVTAHLPGALLVPMAQVTSRLTEIDRDHPVVVCATGNRSGAICEVLRAAGYDALNVVGGTTAWQRSGDARRDGTGARTGGRPVSDLTILPVDTASLGDRSYLVHDGEVAFVVDPQRDIDRVQHLLEQEGVRLTHVLETHIHHDYVTGGHALARATGAAYLVNAADPVSFDRVPVEDRQVVAVGDRMRLTAVATPGHTWTHLSYLLADEQQTLAVLSGGSLLHGSTGRPDLLGPDHTAALVRRQHASAHLLSDLAPGTARLLPTHGFGSFCSATQSDVTASTIGDERLANPVLRDDVETWGGGPAGGPRRLAGVLRPDGPGQPRRARRLRPHSPAPRGRQRDPVGAACR